MKWKKFIWMVLLLLLLRIVASAQQPPNLNQTNASSGFNHPSQIKGGEIITRNGAAYQGVVVQKVVPDGLVIGYNMTDGGMGIAKLKFKDLSASLQQQFDYNSTNAAAFEDEQKHAEGQWRAKWTADDAECPVKTSRRGNRRRGNAGQMGRHGIFSSRTTATCSPVFTW